ncbi:hypothetical protein [Oerskovia turbata]|uniref:hypothetical protein n=1 Tax=Oerskovia turbata TaxID=1713 RepID=UPI000689AA17|nr:hypothetical protein [Oerskovia turbata]
MQWKPGRRSAQRALEDPYEDVPAHLAQPLWNWIDESLNPGTFGGTPRYEEMAIALRIPLPARVNPRQHFVQHCTDDPGFMLDLVDALLEAYGWDDGRAQNLVNLLEAANSAYRVRDDRRGLEERVVPGVRELVAETVNSATGSAGDHLATAWNEAYGRNPDPAKAYSESIKAVEAAFAPLVSPQNAVQTLGTMIRDIGAKPAKWKFVIADGKASEGVETILNMMRVLWDGQTSRHGGLNPTRAETRDEARAAVHLAATLVQLGASRAFDVV